MIPNPEPTARFGLRSPLVHSPIAIRGAIAIGALAIAVRLAAFALVSDALVHDPDAYRSLARVWAISGTYGTMRMSEEDPRSPRVPETLQPTPTAYRPPLYPWLISWAYSGADRGRDNDSMASASAIHDRSWIALWHVALGALTSVLTWLLAMRLGLKPWAGALAALWVLFDPILLRQSTLVMTETLATFLAVVAWWWSARAQSSSNAISSDPSIATAARPEGRNWKSLVEGGGLGVLLGAASLCRATSIAWIVVWGGLCVWRWWRAPAPHRNPQSILRFVSAALAVSLVLGGWGLRNRQQLGAPILTTTHGGYTLYLANNPILYDHWKRSVARDWEEEAFHRSWLEDRGSQALSSELELDRWAQSLAMQTIREQPGTFLWGCAVRQGWFWALWPASRQSSLWQQTAIGGWYAFAFAMAVVGAIAIARSWRIGPLEPGTKRRPTLVLAPLPFWLPAWALLLSLVLVHSVYWSNMRMRAPLVPMISLLAAVGVQRLVGHLAIPRHGGQNRPE